MTGYRVSMDIGGTFTDFALFDDRSLLELPLALREPPSLVPRASKFSTSPRLSPPLGQAQYRKNAHIVHVLLGTTTDL